MKTTEEVRLNTWLAKHHGVLTVHEAMHLGLTRHDLYALVKRGRLERRHAGVYREHPFREGLFLAEAAAALAAGGPGASLSHRSAAWHWETLTTAPSPVELLVPHGLRFQLSGVTVHRTRVPFARRSKDGLRLTEPVRTVMDLAATDPKLLTGVVDRALANRILRIEDLEAATQRGAVGLRVRAARLRQYLEERGYIGSPTPSVLESHMTRLFVNGDLPHPEVEYAAGENGQYRLDFAYPTIKLAIEVDGYAWHWDPDQVRADNERRNRLRAQGWQVLVFTWTQIRDTPDEVVAMILGVYRSLAGV